MIIIGIPRMAVYEKVMEMFRELGYAWFDGKKVTKENKWKVNRELTVLFVDTANKKLMFGSKKVEKKVEGEREIVKLRKYLRSLSE